MKLIFFLLLTSCAHYNLKVKRSKHIRECIKNYTIVFRELSRRSPNDKEKKDMTEYCRQDFKEEMEFNQKFRKVNAD